MRKEGVKGKEKEEEERTRGGGGEGGKNGTGGTKWKRGLVKHARGVLLEKYTTQRVQSV